jgi:hypothetical protein
MSVGTRTARWQAGWQLSNGNGDRDAETFTWIGAPLRSRHSVRFGGVRCDPEATPMARSMGGHRTGSSSGFSRGGSDIADRKCHGKRNAKNGSCKNHSDEASRRQTHDEQWHALTRFWRERSRLEGIGVCSRFAESSPVSSREKEVSSHPAIAELPS